MTGGGEGFLSRWARRKAEVREEAEPDAAQPEPAEIPGESEEEALRRLGLPDPDDLREGDDFTAFLKREVPVALRRRALRRLWRINPALAGLDGLVEYGEDFTAAGTAGAVETAYRLGRGFIDRAQESGKDTVPQAGERGQKEDRPPAEQAQAAAASRHDGALVPLPPGGGAAGNGAAGEEGPSEADGADVPVPPPGRMRFRFD